MGSRCACIATFRRSNFASHCPTATGSVDIFSYGVAAFEFLSGKFTSATTSLCGRNAVQISLGSATRIDFEQIAANLRNVGKASFNKFMLKCPIIEGATGPVDRRREYELTLFADGRAIIKGTNEASVARNLYSKYVGA